MALDEKVEWQSETNTRRVVLDGRIRRFVFGTRHASRAEYFAGCSRKPLCGCCQSRQSGRSQSPAESKRKITRATAARGAWSGRSREISRKEASPERLPAIVRGHSQIENGLYFRRDETLHEDWSQVRRGHAPEVLTGIDNLVLDLLRREGVTNVVQQRRRYAVHLDRALALILQA